MSKMMGKTAAAAAVAAAATGAIYFAGDFGGTGTNQNDFVDDVTAVQVEVTQIHPVSVKMNDELLCCDVSAVVVTPVQDKGVDITVADPAVTAISVSDPADYVMRYAAVVAEQNAMLRDKRNIKHDPTLGSPASTTWVAWKKIYQDPQYQSYTMEFKPLSPELRIITEVWAARDSSQIQTLKRRLAEQQRWGYNAVLVCFDTTEELSDLMWTVNYIRSIGMKVIITYTGGLENLHESVFRDPVKIRRFLMELAPHADALLLGWWRTSVHLFLPDPAYTNYIVKTARSANPDIPIIGQAYWGQTAETGTDHKDFRVTFDVPKNASAVLVMGMGYPRAASKRTLDTLFKDVASHPHKIALVAGERPYFDTRHQTGRSELDNRKIKRALELRLLRAGFQSTMTFSGDGSNGMYEKNKTENLCREYAK